MQIGRAAQITEVIWLKLVYRECEKLRKTLHNLKWVKIVPPLDDVTVEYMKLKNTMKTVYEQIINWKKDNAKLKKAIESNPNTKTSGIPYICLLSVALWLDTTTIA